MQTTLTPQETKPGILKQRSDNEKIVAKYLAIEGTSSESYNRRLALMHPNIRYEITFTKECLPSYTCGLDKVRARFATQSKCWSEYSYRDITIFGTQDPNIFIVECDAEGKMYHPMFTEPRSYYNYYNIIFRIKDKKIYEIRQFTNPYKLMYDFWNKLPDRCL